MMKVFEEQNGAKKYLIRFGDYCDFVDQGKIEPGYKYTRCSRTEGTEDGYYQTPSYEKAFHLAYYGWEEGKCRLAEKRSQYLAGLSASKKNTALFYDHEGAMVDVGRFTQGEPECMLNYYPVDQRKHVTIFYNISVSGSYGAQELMDCSARVTAALDYLEANEQYQFSIYCGEQITPSSGYHSNQNHLWSSWFPAKTSQYAMSSDLLAFTLGHADLLRRIFFAVKETESTKIIEEFGFQGGHGYGSPNSDKLPKYFDSFLPYIVCHRQELIGMNMEQTLAHLKKFKTVRE